MSGVASFVPTPLLLSDSAKARLKSLIEEEATASSSCGST